LATVAQFELKVNEQSARLEEVETNSADSISRLTQLANNVVYHLEEQQRLHQEQLEQATRYEFEEGNPQSLET
jgi:hypothetical protein